MFGEETKRIISWLDNAGYICIDSLEDLTYTTYPNFESLKPVYLGNLPYFITSNPLLKIDTKTGMLTAEYLSQGEYTKIPLVSKNVNENVFQYYVENNKISSSIACFINGLPVLYISMFAGKAHKPDLTGTSYRPLAILYGEGAESISFYLNDGTLIDSSGFYKDKPSDLLHFFSPENITKLFTQGYILVENSAYVSNTKLYGSPEVIPLSVFKKSIKTLGLNGLKTTLQNQHLTDEHLIALSHYMSSNTLRQLWVTHGACTEEVRETVVDMIPHEDLLSEIAGRTTSVALLQKILSSGQLSTLSIGEALSKNPIASVEMITENIHCFTPKMVDAMLYRQEVSPLVFISLLNLQPGNPLLKNVPDLIDVLMEIDGGAAVILKTLLDEDEIVDNDIPKETLRRYAFEAFYLSRMKSEQSK